MWEASLVNVWGKNILGRVKISLIHILRPTAKPSPHQAHSSCTQIPSIFFQPQGSYPLVPNHFPLIPQASRFYGFSKQNVSKWPVNFNLWPPGGRGSFALWERIISLILLGLQRSKKKIQMIIVKDYHDKMFCSLVDYSVYQIHRTNLQKGPEQVLYGQYLKVRRYCVVDIYDCLQLWVTES